MKKNQELRVQKYYLSTLQANVESYIIGCNMYLALKFEKCKLYDDIQSLILLIH